MEEKAMNHKHNEGGFILVTAIILLAILMGLGAAAMFKTNVEMKVSASAADTAKAFAAAQAGLDYVYNYWSQDPNGQVEFKAIATAASAGGTTGTNILIDKAPASITDLGANAMAVDTWVKTSGARVYNLTNAGVQKAASAANWNVDKYAQVAVWVARFKPSTSGYPYATPKLTTDTCLDCTAVTYVLGHSGNAYKLLREYAFISTSTIQARGAMVNAPKIEECDATGPVASTTTNNFNAGSSTTSHMIDATQAPGGTAMATNNSVNITNGNKPWKTNWGTGTNLKGVDPWIVYDPGKVVAGDYPKINGNWMSANNATTVSADLYGTPNQINYFTSATSQLFPLDAYREAANRIAGFSGETLKPDPADPTQDYTVTAGTPLGNYTTLKTNNAGHARTGTIQWPDVIYNIRNNVPMYGLVRLLIPVASTTNTITVCGQATNEYAPKYDPLATTSGGSKIYSPNGKLIVYGGALFDFFIDSNGNDVYEPATEKLVTPREALTFKLNVDSPLMFNPAMDGKTIRTGLSGAANTCDILNINCYPNGSPSWNQTNDKMEDGMMDLVWDVDNIARNWQTQVMNATGTYQIGTPFFFTDWMTQESPQVVTSTATGGGNNWSAADKATMSALLDYYIKTTALASKNTWSDTTRSAIENNAQSFYIDTGNDLVKGQASAADLYHAFLPSGYIHGWKRGLLESGLAAVGSDGVNSIWNQDLIQSPYFTPKESKLFHITGVGANAKVDKDFADIPAEMYAGGLVDMHQEVNISGVVYTPGQLELEQKNKNGHDALQYINGIVITGYGVFMKNETGGGSRTVIAYDDTSIDNLPTNNDTLNLGRKYWQELK